MVKPSLRKAMARTLVSRQGFAVRLACRTVGISTSSYYYQSKGKAEDEQIADCLIKLTQANKRWGFKLCFFYLRNVQGAVWNHKRVYRIYKELALNLRIKPRLRLQRKQPAPLAVPTAANQVWSMDFMSDALADGRRLRLLNVIDDFNREALAMDVALSIPSEQVIRYLERTIEQRGKPKEIRVDNGPEYISERLISWTESQGIRLNYIQPGKPYQNAYIERFNRTVREELLNMYIFDSLEQAELLVIQWQWQYKNVRPNMAIGGVPPRLKAA